LDPTVGAFGAVIIEFRGCFLLGGVLLAATIPFVVWAHFEDSSKQAQLQRTGEKVDWRSLRGLWRDFLAFMSIQAAFNFLTPILPLYLSEAGIGGNLLLAYTGAILSLSSLAYAICVPVTTRLFKRKHMLITLAAA
jgi:hypothetical protein